MPTSFVYEDLLSRIIQMLDQMIEEPSNKDQNIQR